MKIPSTYQSKEELQKLVQRLANGDATAIDILYRLYFKRLQSYGRQIAGKHQGDLVLTVIQEFYMWLVKNHQKMATIEDFEIYLFKSIRLNILNTLKKQQQKEIVAKKFIDSTQVVKATTTPSPEEKMIAQESEQLQKKMLTQVLDQLPTYQKEVLYLRYFQNYSYKEIGAILSVSEQVARNYAYRAVKGMKGQLKDGSLPFNNLKDLGNIN